MHYFQIEILASKDKDKDVESVRQSARFAVTNDELTRLFVEGKDVWLFFHHTCREVLACTTNRVREILRSRGYHLTQINIVGYANCANAYDTLYVFQDSTYGKVSFCQPIRGLLVPMPDISVLLEGVTATTLVRTEDGMGIREKDSDFNADRRTTSITNLSAILFAIRYGNAEDTAATLAEKALRNQTVRKLIISVGERTIYSAYIKHGREYSQAIVVDKEYSRTEGTARSFMCNGTVSAVRRGILNKEATEKIMNTLSEYMTRYPLLFSKFRRSGISFDMLVSMHHIQERIAKQVHPYYPRATGRISVPEAVYFSEFSARENYHIGL